MSAFVLKCIALAAMLVDHIGYVGQVNSLWAGFYYMRVIGRIAMPVYMFLVAEGCRHSRDIKKYLGQLFLFALVSEIPFDLLFQNAGPMYPGKPVTVFYWGSQNVMFTLFLGAVSVAAFRHLKNAGAYIVSLLPLGACALLAQWMHTDYSWKGVVCIFLLSLSQDKKMQLAAMAAVVIILRLNSFSFLFTLFTALALLLVLLYNGKRGPSFKWGFYLAYPLHLMLYAVGWIYWIGPYFYTARI